MQVKWQQLEPNMDEWTGSKLGKEYIKAVYLILPFAFLGDGFDHSLGEGGFPKAVYCHPAYLIYMQSTSCQMLGWMKHKLES